MLRLFFGSPGSGKTTLACFLILRFKKKKKYDRYFANFTQQVGEECSLVGLGDWTFPERSYIAVDEAGIEYNNRKFKTLSHQTIAWLKLHRHYRCDLDFFSQSWEDTDITIRRLVDQLWYVRRIGPFTLVRRVYKRVSVDDDTHQIIDSYEFGRVIRRLLPPPWHERTWYLVYRPKYYQYFDSFECPPLPVRYEKEGS